MISSFLGPKWHSTIGSMSFPRTKKLSISRAQPPPTCPSNGCCPRQKHYERGGINHRCIGPPWRGLRVHTSKTGKQCSGSIGSESFWASRIRIRIHHYLYGSGCGSGSGYGSFHRQAKKLRKSLISTVL